MTRRGAFCFVCGNAIENFKDGKCRECYFQDTELLILPSNPNVKICKQCLSYFKDDRWNIQKGDLDSVVKVAVNDSLLDSMILKNIIDEDVALSVGGITYSNPNKLFLPYTLKITGLHRGETCSVENSGKVTVNLTFCNSCLKKKSRYYEAVIQIRGEDLEENKVKSSSIEYLNNLQIKDNNAFVSDFKLVKNGFDIYIGSLSAGRKISKYLNRRFGGILKQSAKLVGRGKDGKDIYRVTISLKFPRFMLEDVVNYKDKLIQIQRFKGNNVIALDLNSNQTLTLPMKSLNRADIVRRKGDIS